MAMRSQVAVPTRQKRLVLSTFIAYGEGRFHVGSLQPSAKLLQLSVQIEYTLQISLTKKPATTNASNPMTCV